MGWICPECGGGPVIHRGMAGHEAHDHRPDRGGLDDGLVYLPGCAPRKKPAPKPPEEMADIRARAWATRRQKYGQCGHDSGYGRG